MKTSVLLVVLCTGVAMAMYSGDMGHKVPTVLLRSGTANESKAVRDKLDEAFEKATECIMGLMPNATSAEKEAKIMECLNNHKDNTECCKKAGFTDDKCAKAMCDGKPPVEPTLDKDEIAKCGNGSIEAAVLGIAQCYLDSY